jgi:hypothetical protein
MRQGFERNSVWISDPTPAPSVISWPRTLPHNLVNRLANAASMYRETVDGDASLGSRGADQLSTQAKMAALEKLDHRLGMFKDNDGLSGNITLIGTLATCVSMSARRSMPGTGLGRDRQLPNAGGN